MSLENNIAKYLKDKGIVLSVVARETGIPYMALYDSFFNAKKQRPIKGSELIKVCHFLDINPMEFRGDEQ